MAALPLVELAARETRAGVVAVPLAVAREVVGERQARLIARVPADLIVDVSVDAGLRVDDLVFLRIEAHAQAVRRLPNEVGLDGLIFERAALLAVVKLVM